MYLKQDPRIWFWSDGATMHIEWDNEGLELERHQPWASIRGHMHMPIDEFMNELSSFNGRLMQAMGERVLAIDRSWHHPEVELDIAGLHQSQREMSSFFPRALEQARASKTTRWDEVVEAIRFFENRGYPLN